MIWSENNSTGICDTCGYIVWVQMTDTLHYCQACNQIHEVAHVSEIPEAVMNNRRFLLH